MFYTVKTVCSSCWMIALMNDSDDEPKPMKRAFSFGKSALNSLRCISKLVKKNYHSLDVPLVADAPRHS